MLFLPHLANPGDVRRREERLSELVVRDQELFGQPVGRVDRRTAMFVCRNGKSFHLRDRLEPATEARVEGEGAGKIESFSAPPCCLELSLPPHGVLRGAEPTLDLGSRDGEMTDQFFVAEPTGGVER